MRPWLTRAFPKLSLKYSDGLSPWRSGIGDLAAWCSSGSTADTAWNDLPVRLPFVPLLHRALGSIVQRARTKIKCSCRCSICAPAQHRTAGEGSDVFETAPNGRLRETRVGLVNASPLQHAIKRIMRASAK